MPSLVKSGPVVLDKKVKMLKVNRQTDGQTDDGRQVITKLTSFQLRFSLSLSVGKNNSYMSTVVYALFLLQKIKVLKQTGFRIL